MENCLPANAEGNVARECDTGKHLLDIIYKFILRPFKGICSRFTLNVPSSTKCWAVAIPCSYGSMPAYAEGNGNRQCQRNTFFKGFSCSLWLSTLALARKCQLVAIPFTYGSYFHSENGTALDIKMKVELQSHSHMGVIFTHTEINRLTREYSLIRCNPIFLWESLLPFHRKILTRHWKDKS